MSEYSVPYYSINYDYIVENVSQNVYLAPYCDSNGDDKLEQIILRYSGYYVLSKEVMQMAVNLPKCNVIKTKVTETLYPS